MNRLFSLWAGLTVHEPGHVFHEPNKCSVRMISVSCRQHKWRVQYCHDETNPDYLTNKIVELCRTEFKLGNRGGSYIFIHIWTMSWRMMENIPLECTVNITIFIADVVATSGTMESAAIVLSLLCSNIPVSTAEGVTRRGRDKWLPFFRRHFQMDFFEWKCMYFNWIFFYGSNLTICQHWFR